MDKQEITGAAAALGTFEISAEPDQDCCTLFVPRHPSTRVGREEIRALEGRLDIERLVKTGVEGAREEAFTFPHAPAWPEAVGHRSSLSREKPNI
jgi:thiamine biosynthesis protein ThiI